MDAYRLGQLTAYLVLLSLAIGAAVVVRRRHRPPPPPWAPPPPPGPPPGSPPAGPQWSPWATTTGGGPARPPYGPSWPVQPAAPLPHQPPAHHPAVPAVPASGWPVAAAPSNRPPGWVWLLAIPAGLMVTAMVAAVAIPTFLGARERAQQRQAARVDATARRLAAPEEVAGLARNHDPTVDQTTGEMLEAARQGGVGNAVAAVYGPDAGGRALLVAAIRTSSAPARESFTRDAPAGLAAAAGVDTSQARRARLDRAGIGFSCTELPDNSRAISAVCTWDDGDTAGMGVGYGRLPADALADLLATAHSRLRG